MQDRTDAPGARADKGEMRQEATRPYAPRRPNPKPWLGPDWQEKAKSTGAGGGNADGLGIIALFTATTFLSAVLLFSVQPMFAKMVLPVLGGAPSVWAVAMLFFQAALLAGYCYAHALIRFLPAATTGFVHLAVSALAFVALPIALPAGYGEPPPGEPYLWQLGLFAVAVGLPFFAVAANAPLLQAWFSATGHPQGRDPYFLYGASNLGSLLALLSYPLLLEPAFGLRQLSSMWSAGFGLLVLALAAAFAAVRLSGHAAVFVKPGLSLSTGDRHPGWGDRLRWIGLALVPSALLTAFTNHVTMDVASAPLLWVLPLALYLLTFVLVFRERPIVLVPVGIIIGLGVAAGVKFYSDRFLSDEVALRTVGFAGGAAGLLFLIGQYFVGPLLALAHRYMSVRPMAWMRGVHLAAVVLALLALSQTRFESWFISAATGVAVFFASTMVAHRTLYEARPASRHLTEFYLWMSFGGVLGGLFAALIAPKIFSEVFEYPILLALTMACRPGALDLKLDWKRRDDWMILWLLLAAAILTIMWVPHLLPRSPRVDTSAIPAAAWWIRAPFDGYMKLRAMALEWGATALLGAAFALALLACWRHPPRQLVLALAMCAAVVLLPSGVRRSDAERSYFGVYRVYAAGNYNILMHGTTLHGAQRIRDDEGNSVLDTTPGTYYHPASPMARSVELVREHVSAKDGGTNRYGVVGLGSGSLSCLAGKGERWRFFEIDPVMIKLTTNPENFSYLANCQPNPPDIVIGDARLTLAREQSGSFDLIIVDAFSSDAVPVHLMTAEAIRLYLDKLGPNGIAVLHISNRYLDLDSVLGATVKLIEGAHGLIVSDDTSDGSYGATSSTIAVFARNPEALIPFRGLSDVRELDPHGIRAWTDDFSDILGPFLSKMKIAD